jgi:hypothetical protein
MPGVESDTPKKPGATRVVGNKDGGQKHACPYPPCVKRYRQKESLYRHIRQEHADRTTDGASSPIFPKEDRGSGVDLGATFTEKQLTEMYLAKMALPQCLPCVPGPKQGPSKAANDDHDKKRRTTKKTKTDKNDGDRGIVLLLPNRIDTFIVLLLPNRIDTFIVLLLPNRIDTFIVLVCYHRIDMSNPYPKTLTLTP